MRCLVADKFPQSGIDALASLGLDVSCRAELTQAELGPALAGVAVLIVRGREVRADAIAAGDALSLIVRAGAGVNTIDVAAASERGIYVANCPGKNAIAVAELAMALLCAIDRRVPEMTRDLQAGRWAKGEYGNADGLYGKRMGLLGFGSIGREVAIRARAFGMQVQAWSRSLTAEAAAAVGARRAANLTELAASSDVVSVHLPLTAETRGLCDEAFFASLPQGAIFLNTARGEIVDDAALRRAIETRHLRVGMDVYAREPQGSTGTFDDELVRLPGVVGSHHVGASTHQAQQAIADETIRIVRSFVQTGEVPNCVNIATRSPASFQLIVRHVDKVGVLANVLGIIKAHAINAQELENTVFEGARAACCKIKLDSRPGDDVLDEIRGLKDQIIHVERVALS
jgi:D-3-phosphoglycerate dehydrogenase